MILDKSKVLLLYNTDVALSGAVADYYIAARQLTPRKLGFAWGTNMQNSSAITLAHIITVANYVIANGIQAVYMAPMTPNGVLRGGTVISSDNVMATSILWKQLNSVSTVSLGGKDVDYINSAAGFPYRTKTYHSTWTPTSAEDGLATTLSVGRYASDAFASFSLAGSAVQLHGRIGFASLDIAKQPDPTFARCKEIIDTAIASERGVTELAGLPVHFFNYYGNIADGPYSNARAWQELSKYGFKKLVVSDGTGNDIPYFAVRDYPQEAITGATGQAVPKEDVFAMLGFCSNYGRSTYYSGNVDTGWSSWGNLLPGAFAAGGASWGLAGPFYELLRRPAGMVTAIGCYYEPFASAMVNTHTLTKYLLLGFSMSEAMMISNCQYGWMLSCWGDPMYAPFAKNANIALF